MHSKCNPYVKFMDLHTFSHFAHFCCRVRNIEKLCIQICTIRRFFYLKLQTKNVNNNMQVNDTIIYFLIQYLRN